VGAGLVGAGFIREEALEAAKSFAGKPCSHIYGCKLPEVFSSPPTGFALLTTTHSFGPQAPWHFLNFLLLPHGHGSLRPTSFSALRTGSW